MRTHMDNPTRLTGLHIAPSFRSNETIKKLNEIIVRKHIRVSYELVFILKILNGIKFTLESHLV